MMVSSTRLKQEILNTKAAISKLEKIYKDCISGIEVNQVVLKAFEDALKSIR